VVGKLDWTARGAVPDHIGGARAVDTADRGEPPGDQARVLKIGDSYRQVEPLGEQVHLPFVEI
jgi:hypothetical protein